MEGHLVCSATQTIGLLAFIYLFYTQSFGFDPIKLFSGTRDLVKNATMEEVGGLEDNLQPLFKSFIGDGDQQKLETTGFACDSTFYSLVCVASNHVKIDTKTMEIYMPTRFNSTNDTNTLDKEEKKVVQVKPYPWSQINLLKTVTSVKFLQQPPQTTTRFCNYNYTVPVVVFSSGGFAGNLFHEFNEIIIPLYITSRLFKSRVQFILVDYNPSLVKKYERIFSSLSRYNVLNPMMNISVHCFPGAVVGLKSHGFLRINSSEVPKGNSMIEFRKFLGIAYGLKITNVSNTAPRLLLVSRRKTRSFLNEDELVDMMEELGFDVVVVRSPKKMSNLERFAKLVSTCSVLIGAHGAGLTNQVFLPTGAVVVQVVPLGLEWPSSVYFGEPAVRMGLHYLDYKIGPNESSLIDMYAHDDPVISDPGSVFAKGYYVGKEMYLDKQNIRVDVNRFKGTLVEALTLLKNTNPLST
ncbi:hypothetical protein M8C21_025765 [Ambrosia artemisiifolia]|uniref:Glycosyltransferase 61 catalytic domain-containing protein n=1 Tax=Ambrosia artemisiifolia TaxID=4212 RepID=A0AAD5CJP0_AMBAR|nr:hypothetical protein M8C21_025765 [Ambrosia artemisiifolia]